MLHYKWFSKSASILPLCRVFRIFLISKKCLENLSIWNQLKWKSSKKCQFIDTKTLFFIFFTTDFKLKGFWIIDNWSKKIRKLFSIQFYLWASSFCQVTDCWKMAAKEVKIRTKRRILWTLWSQQGRKISKKRVLPKKLWHLKKKLLRGRGGV